MQSGGSFATQRASSLWFSLGTCARHASTGHQGPIQTHAKRAGTRPSLKQNWLASSTELSKLRLEMSKSLTGDQILTPLTEGHRVESASEAETNAGEISDLLLEISEQLASSNPLVHKNPVVQDQPPQGEPVRPRQIRKHKPQLKKRDRRGSKKRESAAAVKQRFGLPQGFVPRWQRFERGILLELNIYRLPNGLEFLPSHPSGTLGAQRHLYALLSVEQYVNKKKGSVYVRTDGRIFDYSVDSGVASGDIFDTGYTIYDLERTGRYAPSVSQKKKKREPEKHRRVASAG